MSIDPKISVYTVPVTITTRAHVFVLATSAAAALASAAKLDLGELAVGDDELVRTADTDRMALDDWDTPVIATAPQAVALPVTEYDPEDHPDYNPAEHDEPAGDDEATDDEGELRS